MQMSKIFSLFPGMFIPSTKTKKTKNKTKNKTKKNRLPPFLHITVTSKTTSNWKQMVVNLSKLKSDFRIVTVTMYQTKKYKQAKKGKKNGRQWFCSSYPLIEREATVAESLQSSHSHRSAHAGSHDGRGLFSTRLGGYLVFFKAEPRFGEKIISWLTRPHYKQDKPNTPAYRNPAHCLY